jgi:hypothetical protein
MWKAVPILIALCAVAHAKDAPDVAAIKKLVAAQAAALSEGGDTADPKVFTKSTTTTTPEGGLGGHDNEGLRSWFIGGYLTGVKPSGIKVGLARDGKSAWVTFDVATKAACNGCEEEAGPTVRTSQLVVKVGNAWLVEASLWSQGVADAKINKEAKAGKQHLPAEVTDADAGDAAVRTALKTLITKGFDAAAAKSADAVGIGSAPKEVVGFKNLVPYFNKAWAGKLAIKGPVWATVAPSGTTAAAIANVELTKTEGKTSYKVVFRWFVVFDKDAAGAWAPVHVHFAVATASMP